MQKLSLQVKIGALMTLAILLISATGYLSFRSLSAIVSSIKVKSKPDLRLLTISEISNDLEKAENSVRLFTYTRKKKDIEPYYNTIAGFDEKVARLRTASLNDTLLMNQIDTISQLIEDEILIWNQMLDLYHSDLLDNFIRNLTAKLAVGTLSNKNTDKSILKRVFSKRADKPNVQQEIIRDLNAYERQDSIKNKRLLATESQLAITGTAIRERFYILISKMEDEVDDSIEMNARTAEGLALKTYHWLAMFAILGTVLVILVLAIVVRFVRKTRDYERALIQSRDETEKTAHAREIFMATMSHEIRTPVNAIYGFAEQLAHKSFDETSRKIVDIIKSSADHLVKIVDDILDISKLQNAKIVLEKAPFQLSLVFEEIQLLFENKSAQKGTRLHHSVGKSMSPLLLGDSYRLKQILINLVGNSVKFTSGGEIHFSADCGPKNGDSFDLIVKVEDSGIGISEDRQAGVFDEFTQADEDTSRKYGGTGLGLSIVKKLVDLHRGSVSLQSKKNRGTTVTCILPFSAATGEDVPENPRVTDIPDKIRDLNILVVDDEEYNRMLFSTIFNRWKIRYDEAADGLKALELIKTNQYDLVFMDIRMPSLNGIETSKYLRDELKIGKDVLPVIGISATHTGEDIQEYLRSGINTFLPKPFTEKMLTDIILSVVDPETHKFNAEEPGNTGQNLPGPRIDLSHLYQLADHDIPFIRQMLTRFIEGTEQGLQDIEQAVKQGQTHVALETAHKIAAPCKHVGAEKLYMCLKSIENEAQHYKNGKILSRLCRDSEKEFAEIKEILTDHIMKMNE